MRFGSNKRRAAPAPYLDRRGAAFGSLRAGNRGDSDSPAWQRPQRASARDPAPARTRRAGFRVSDGRRGSATERRRAAEIVADARSRFLAMMSHGIRTP